LTRGAELDEGGDGGGEQRVSVSLRIDPLGAGFFVRGGAAVAPPPRRACGVCGAAFDSPLESEFQVWCVVSRVRFPCALHRHARSHARTLPRAFISYAPRRLTEQVQRRNSRARRRRSSGGGGDDALFAPSADDDDEMLLFPSHAASVDLTSVVRDSLLLALPAQPRCGEAACGARAAAAAAALAAEARKDAAAAASSSSAAAGPFAKLSALRTRISAAEERSA
jgi:hypothetical protein